MTLVVQDILNADPAVCFANEPIIKVARQMAEQCCGLIPVVDSLPSGKLEGAITDRDIVTRIVAEGRNPLCCTVRDAMSGSVRTLPITASLTEAAEMIRDAPSGRIVIVDCDGRLRGVISEAEIAGHTAQHGTPSGAGSHTPRR